MTYSTQNTDQLTSILNLCRQVTPYLNGKFEATHQYSESEQQTMQWLIGEAQDKLTIQALIADLKQQYPDAGSAYFKARSWHLLYWQPLYITFISIYGLKKLPDFTDFKQQRQHNAIVGFIFQSNKIASAETQQLIPLAATQLKPLFEHYRMQLDSLQRCRPGYAGRFIADLILENLLKVKSLITDFSDQDVLHHARLWIKAMDLPEKLIDSLIIKKDAPIQLIRTSCCLAYKVNEKLCSTCPKAHK